MRSSLGAALCVCVLLAAAMPSAVHAQAEDRVMAAPATCPNYCGSCVRMRGKKVLSAETVVVAPASANGRRLLTAPVRTVCTSCLDSFVPNKAGTACDCPPGTYLKDAKCEKCPPNTISPGGKPGRPCRPCKKNTISNAEGTKCIAVSPACGSRECGTVGNAYCGSCAAGQTCSAAGTCEVDNPEQGGNANNNGGPTPPPPPPPPAPTCEPACAAGEVCDNGVCKPVTPPPPPACEPACAAGEVCDNGVCKPVAPPPPATCEPACAAGEVCDNGVCKPVAPPPPPACEPACAAGEVCDNGVCKPVAPPPATCVPLLGLCGTDADCCGHASTGSPTICNPDTKTCTYTPGGGCVRDGKCGMCHPNCGGQTESSTCLYYGFDANNCNHSAAGGGGGECGKTDICCVVWNPVHVQPNAQNECVKA